MYLISSTEPASARMGDLSVSNLQHKLIDEVKNDTATLNTPYARPVFKSDDDMKNADTFDVPVSFKLSRWSLFGLACCFQFADSMCGLRALAHMLTFFNTIGDFHCIT